MFSFDPGCDYITLAILSTKGGITVSGYNPKSSLLGVTLETKVICRGGVYFGMNPVGLGADIPLAVYYVVTGRPSLDYSSRLL